VSSLGHGNQEIIDAICEQAKAIAFAHSSFFTSNPAEELARTILENSDGAYSKATFLMSGSEAVKSATTIARQCHVYRGEPERVNFIGRKDSYHGNTLGALAAGYNQARREPFTPVLGQSFHHVSLCFNHVDGNGLSEPEYEDNMLAEYESECGRLGTHTFAAVILEPFGGATLGSVPATQTYQPRLVALSRRHSVLRAFFMRSCAQWLVSGPIMLGKAWEGLRQTCNPLARVLVQVTSHFPQS
jgi:adenosylmethionine-8-amino-7-oxononanoate aminotransferase